MRILVTGSEGFIGKNLVSELNNRGIYEVYTISKNYTEEQLDEYCQKAEFVFHLAGVNRSNKEEDFENTNVNLTEKILQKLDDFNNNCTIMYASSIQVELDNAYGKSKLKAEKLLLGSIKKATRQVQIYRLPNVFGKWCKPNYNSVIATFCYNISRDIPIKINDENTQLKLVYIDDLVKTLINNINKITESTIELNNYYLKNLKTINELLTKFKESRDNKFIINVNDSFEKKLYSTYLSYLPTNQFSYPLKMNIDQRGSFTEVLKTPDRGQVSINISKPGIVKGNHWHHTKNEKFLVVSGNGVIRFREYHSENVIEYFVSDEKLEVVDIPIGYTHSIENLGEANMVTMMWVNEIFDEDNPDTFFMEV